MVKLTTEQREQRDALICLLFTEGETQQDLANRFHTSKLRIAQILKKNGVTKEDRPKLSSRERKSFVGIDLVKEIKDALKQEAAREEKSMSQWVSNLIEKELKNRGVVIAPEPLSNEIDVPLPLEG